MFHLKRLFILTIVLLFLSGCTKQEGHLDAINGNENEDNNTSVQDSKLEEVELRLKEAENQLTQLKNVIEMNSGEINRLTIHLTQAQHVLNSIPALQVKQGYITNIDSNETLQVQQVNLVDDPTAPNGFVIEKADIVTIKLNNKARIYNDPQGTSEVSIDEFSSRKEHPQLYKIYIINNEIIMLTEMYIP
ncbi:MAG TPA: hypothetical protein VFX18_01415 [Candidatus Nitrosocosmicus sp.]|nr:hypothetical protein [Candidatus Nitrosocosmicus sp.]